MLLPKTLLGKRYSIVRRIGQGGMGSLYEAVDTRLTAIVAVKQATIDSDQLNKAFEDEARLLATLRHTALPKVTDYFTEPFGKFLVMEFIPGLDLKELLEQRGHPFGVDEVLTWADQLLDALGYLHTQRPPVIHRDIKPQNLKLTSRGEIILLDFGLAKGTLAPSVQAFTVQYAPVEQIRGTGTDARSDLYALAATLHHLLTGTPPENAATRIAALLNHQPDPQRPTHEINPQVPEAVSAVLARDGDRGNRAALHGGGNAYRTTGGARVAAGN